MEMIMQRWVYGLLSLGLVIFALQPAHAATATLESVKSPRGVTEKFILIKPDKPVAAVILFAGGHGGLGLKSASSMNWGKGNFLVRMREAFAKEGFVVAVLDAPSDRPKGMNAIFRMSKDHADDIGAVAAYLKKDSKLPVWVVGTSMGTFSAANGAIGATNVDGLVLTSTITRSKRGWKIESSHRDGVASMPLEKVSGPALIMSHKKDGCDITPASDAPKLQARLTKAAKTEIVLIDGGRPPQSEPCEAKAQHGYFGVESEAVAAIAKFIKTNSH
jgi:pimeloyl-ACP methyl ester carboxylesterase